MAHKQSSDSAALLPRRLLIIFLFVLGAAMGLATAALGYSYQKSSCDGRDAMFYTFQDGPWTAQRESWFNDAASAWDDVKTPGGGAFTSSGENGVIDIHIDDLDAGANGRTNCGWFGDLVSIVMANKSSVIDSEAKFTSVAMHEVGHSHGVGHAGAQDGVPPPLMRCTIYAGQSITGDDAASLGVVFSTASAQGNPSFENGLDYWKSAAGAGLSSRSGGAPKGNGYVRVSGSYGGYIFQSVRIVKVIDTSDNEDDLGLKGYFQYRKVSGTGTITAQVWAQKYNYTVSEDEGCRYRGVSEDTDDGPVHLDDTDTDGPVTVGAFELKKTKTVQPTSTTQWTESSTAAWPGFSGWDGGQSARSTYVSAISRSGRLSAPLCNAA